MIIDIPEIDDLCPHCGATLVFAWSDKRKDLFLRCPNFNDRRADSWCSKGHMQRFSRPKEQKAQIWDAITFGGEAGESVDLDTGEVIPAPEGSTIGEIADALPANPQTELIAALKANTAALQEHTKYLKRIVDDRRRSRTNDQRARARANARRLQAD